jgi:hypothetical protein
VPDLRVLDAEHLIPGVGSINRVESRRDADGTCEA